MARTLKEVIDSLPLDERQEVEARAAWLIAEETRLRDLMHELRSHFEPMGGKLRVTVEFPNRRPMEMTDPDDIVAEETAIRRDRPKSRSWRFRSIDRARKNQSLRDGSSAGRHERMRAKRPA